VKGREVELLVNRICS